MKYIISLLSLMFLIGCKDSGKEENIKLNQIIKVVTSDTKSFKNSNILIKDTLKQLVIYVPSKDEIEQKIPSPPSGKTTSILRLLHFKKKYTEKDSLKLLTQNDYPLKRIIIDKTINPNLRISRRVDEMEGKKFFSFSNPIYFENNYAYIEVGFYDYGFSKGTAYLLQKENEIWKIVEIRPLWMT